MDIPASSPEGKDWIYKNILQLKRFGINRVIDIGCGAGTYYNYYNSIINAEWVGVEIWKPYVEEYNLLSMYKNVIINDASKINYSELGKFDIAFVGDVLEHMTKESAVTVINELTKICKFIFISIPIIYYPSEEYEHNQYLRHIKPDWSDKEVKDTFHNIVSSSLGDIVGNYLITTENMNIVNKHFHFIIGLPRSGSTMLGALLRQNKDVYVTSTSPMLDQLVANQDIYKYKLSSTKANYIQEQLDNITLNMIQGMWKHVPENIIIDSNRGWGKNLPSVKILFKQKIKCIGLYRNIPEVMASWLKLIKKNTNNYIDIELTRQGLELTDKNKMIFMWENMVKDCVEALIYAVRDDKENVLLVDYNDLCDEPKKVLTQINEYLGLPIIEYDLNNININSIIQKDELSWGLAGMHAVREKLEKVGGTALEVLGNELFEYFTIIDNQFKEEINGK